MEPANRINHIIVVADASYSMKPHLRTLPQVADNLVAYLAERSKVWDQETRITLYDFSNDVRCLIYDKDVLRMPSIKDLYQVRSQTALRDAACLAIDDLQLVSTKYGEHSFLIYVLTDGMENVSKKSTQELSSRIERLPDNWTLAVFVPNQNGVFEAKKFGFPAANISVWDTASKAGLESVGKIIRDTSESFFEARSRGVRGSKNIFQLNTVSAADIQANLMPLAPFQYNMLYVGADSRADDFVLFNLGRNIHLGEVYYQLTKTETIQDYKKIAILYKNQIYVGQNARTMLGLPSNDSVRVRPSDYVDYKIFVQSTAPNRKLLAGTSALILP